MRGVLLNDFWMRLNVRSADGLSGDIMKAGFAFASALAVSLAPAAALAQSWQQVYPTPPEYSLYYDANSPYREGSMATLVTLANFPSGNYDANVAGGSRPYYSTSNVTVFDCAAFEIAGIGDFMYHSQQWAAGDLILQVEGFDRTRRPIHSGTANEVMYHVACK
jgi:hypothetical protein